jgi:hypothetical protein
MGTDMTGKRIPKGLAGDILLTLGVLMWCAGYVIGRVIGWIERGIRGRRVR